MTRQEYEQKIDKIISLLDENEQIDVEKELEALKRYYPIRLSWHYAKTKNDYCKDKDKAKVYQGLNGKFLTLYEYKGNGSCLRLYQDVVLSVKNYFDYYRYHNILCAFNDDWNYYTTLCNNCVLAMQNTSPDNDLNAYRSLYSCREYVGYIIHQKARRVRFPHIEPIREVEWINKLPNMGFFLHELSKEGTGFFVFVESENNTPIIDLLCDDLKLLGKEVIRIKPPVVCEGDGIAIRDTLPISIDSKEECAGIICFTPVELLYADGRRVDNRQYILNYISAEYNGGKQLHVLADGWLTDDMSLREDIRRKMIRITPYTADMDQYNLAYFVYGDYLEYVSKVYAEDCRKLVDMESSVRFSIVIPARNSAETLRYTLQTCLEQTYTGSYEIIVSDNSTGENASVYNLCKELSDPRIVYIKTPRDLPLPKSFEYAFLHAKGEYIFGLGSDDGVLPWALETLEQVISQYPDEEIIQWQRGFYAWPGFNGGQQHQFVIPEAYKKGELNLFYKNRLDSIAAALKEPQTMYELPMLYINSCFKRSYMNTLLEKTERLWDGICQDIYMGVVTACIKPQILNMRYPLTIAGMSNGSVGAHANQGQKTNEEFSKLMCDNQRDNNVGGFCASYWERLLPQTGTDTSSLYGSFLRAVSFGILPEEYLDKVFHWKEMFMRLARELDVRDVAFDRKIHEMRYVAMKHGEEFLQWFDETIYEPALEPRLIDEAKIQERAQKKTYQCGATPMGGQVLDVSEYGVENIHDAVKLFARMTEL